MTDAVPRKIVIVSDTIYPYFKGGKEQRILHITTRLADMGYDVHIYTMKWWDGPQTIIQHGVHLHGISGKRDVYSDESRRSMRASAAFAINCLRLARVKFDIVDVDHMPYLQLFTVWLVCKLKRRRMYATWHEVWDLPYWRQYLGWLGFIGYAVEWLAAWLPDYIIANSVDTRNKLIARHPARAARIMAAYNGVNLPEIIETPPAKRRYDVMYAGRLIKHKNVATLIKAIARVRRLKPNITCVILGDGPDKKNLVSLVERLGLQKNVRFMGFLPEHRDVYGYMKSVKVFVQPSKREGFGLVVVEANACGTPVLTLDHPDNAATSLIQDGINGYVFKNTADLASRILDYAARPTKDANPFAEDVQKYDWQHVTATVAEVYAQ